jgi:hypothetical protein
MHTDNDGLLEIVIPTNLEAFADDFQAVAACCAIGAIQEKIVLIKGTQWPIEKRLTEKSKSIAQYFSGIACALRHASSNPQPGFTGNFGNGYNLVVHRWASKHNIPGWLLQGKPKRFSQILNKKAWGSGVTSDLTRLEALIIRGAEYLDLSPVIGKFCREAKQLQGHGIRARLPWKREGVLSKPEVDCLSNRFQVAEECYNNMLQQLSPETATAASLVSFPATLQDCSQRLKAPCLVVEQLVNGRFAVLVQGLNKRQLKTDAKKPIGDRIRDLDPKLKALVFHPLFLLGRKFHPAEDSLAAIKDDGNFSLYENQIDGFCRVPGEDELNVLAKTYLMGIDFSQGIEE